eukprot:tig00000113_g5612.t1
MSADIARAAVLSRATVLGLGALSASLLEPYDTSASVPDASGEPAASGPLRGFGNWDGVYFLAIARRGYVYEQEHAFFPLYPLCVRWLAAVARPLLLGAVSESQLFLLSALVVSNCAFVAAAVVLHRLCLALTSDAALSRRAAALFCAAPASVFLSAAYTESLFALLSFSGALLLARGRPTPAALLFALAAATRSNGALLALLLAHAGVAGAWAARPQPPKALLSLVAAGLRCLLVLAPLAAFQYQGYSLFCAGPAPPRPWCSRPVPLLYSFVQDRYWNVGFLRYYELKQIPNFALATPALLLSAAGVLRYSSAAPRRLLTAGIDPGRGPASSYLSPRVAPLVLLWGFSALVAAFCMHVQVATRFLSASAPFYLYCATLAAPPPPAAKNARPPLTRKAAAVWGYFLGYAVVGTVLFTTFYPWT